MRWFMRRLEDTPDTVLLLVGGGFLAVLALAIATLARRFIFEPRQEAFESDTKLADQVHGSLLAFTVFTLALVLTDVRGNMGNTLDSTHREASVMVRLDAELDLVGNEAAQAARQSLRTYAERVVDTEWHSLGTTPPRLDPGAHHALRVLKADARAAARSEPEIAAHVTQLVHQLEELRLERFESATHSVPRVFWWIVFAFLLGAMIMNGRYGRGPATGGLIALHMMALGLVIMLIFVLDEPFRGESAVSPDPIARALEGGL